MKTILRHILPALVLLTFVQAQPSFTVHGRVIDAVTNDSLPLAIIKIAGTSQGTVTNVQGEFRFTLHDSSAALAVSYIGYVSDTVAVSMTSSHLLDIHLQPNAIQFPDVVVRGSTEDPAYEIIRSAIENKKRWMQRLTSYEGRTFTRMVVRAQDSIAAVMESYSTLYWQSDDSLREVITQQKQTGNLPKGIQPSRVGDIVNFNDDTIRLGGFRVTGPTAPDAFDNYDYKLQSTRKMDDFEVYIIQVIPKSKINPLFRGTISIAERSYAIMEADLAPNEAFVQPFIRSRNIHYKQTFRLFNRTFWLPTNYHFDGSIEISIMGLKIPSIGVAKDVVVYDYQINPELPDSLRTISRVTVDSASTKVDSAFWAVHNVLPLTTEEDRAYQKLDSTQSLEKQFAPSGFLVKLLTTTSTGPLSYLDFSFNRVEAWHLGLSKKTDIVSGIFDVHGGAAYGTADRIWKWDAGSTWSFGGVVTGNSSMGTATFFETERRYSISIDGYRQLQILPLSVLQDRFFNAIDALFTHEDIYDYFMARGGTLSLIYHPVSRLHLTLTALSEEEQSAAKNTEYSFFYRSHSYRENPFIVDGQMNSLKLAASYASTAMYSLRPQALIASVQIEHTEPSWNSDFSFTQANAKLSAKIPVMNTNLLFPPSITVVLEGGTTAGHLPVQRWFSLVSPEVLIGEVGNLHDIDPYDFFGDQYVKFYTEYNFQRAPFVWTNIRPLYESNLELIVFSGVARSWLTNNVLLSSDIPMYDTRGWYYEAGAGISNILDFFRFDVAYRISRPQGWYFTLRVSDIIAGFAR
jgi:Family of unknown function (DUF5686)/CarboxypepD_reg-like domain